MVRPFPRRKRGTKPVAAPDAELLGRFADIVGRARKQAAEASSGSDPVALFLGLRRFYKETGTAGLMTVALELGDMAICACPPGDPRRPDVLAESCAVFRMAYEEAASPPPEARELLRQFPQLPELLLRRAIEDGRAAVAAATAGHSAYLAARTHLGNALLTQFQHSGDASALDEAVARHNEVLDRLPPDHPELVTVHANLGNVLRLRAASDDDGSALDHAISHYRRALAEAAKRDEPAATIQVGLGEALIMLAARDGNMVAAGEAGQMLRAAAAALPAHHPALALLRGQLDRLDLADAAAAEAARVQAAAASPADPAAPADPAGAQQRAIAEFEHMIGIYEDSGHLPHLVGAIEGLRALLAGSAPGHAEPLGSFGRYHAFHALGTALWSLFERTGDLAALDESAACLHEAAQAPGVDGELRLKSEANLAGVLILRGRHTGRRADLERSIALARSVVEQTPAGDPALGGRITTVALGLQWLMQQTGDSGLAREAVEVYRAAIAAQEANGTASEPPALSNLGLSLLDLWQLTRQRAALDEAVDLCRQAAELSPPGHPLAPRMQGNLATALQQRYLATAGDDGDREAATAAARRAFAATAEDHPNRAERGFLLASLLLDGYAASRDLRTLDEVVATATMAVRAAPPGHQLWAQNSTLLATARTLRGRDHAGSSADLRAAETLLAEVAATPGVPASLRVRASRQQSVTELLLGDPGAALRAAQAAVEQLPQVAPRNLARADQERPLAGLRGLGSDACALAIAAGDPELALSLLEQGRGILLQQAADGRADLTELRAREPALAAELERVRDLLDPANLTGPPSAPAGQSPGVTSAGLAAQRREALAAEWEDLLTRIRDRPGFDRFLRLPDVTDLAARCAGGHAVAVNVSVFRCDALIVTPGGVRVLPLPGLTLAEAESRAATFSADIAESWWQPGAGAGRVRETLRWLWEAVCAPVLDAIGATGTPASGEPWPRVWWVPTGPLAFLPLHAACRDLDGDPAGTDTVLDRVVSSYLPAIRGLPAAAAGPVPVDDSVPVDDAGPVAALVIAMPETPGQADLDVADEARHVAGCLPGTKVLTGAEATHESVRVALSRFPWVHFACHAVGTARDGAGARLLLHDHEERPLTVREIALLRPHRAELAYLSACESAYGPAGLADEAVHLAGTFHLAGYEHVIGTLWPAADHVAAEIAVAVYERITTPVPDVATAALALHDAVRRTRDRNRDLPVLWAAHIHVGR